MDLFCISLCNRRLFFLSVFVLGTKKDRVPQAGGCRRVPAESFLDRHCKEVFLSPMLCMFPLWCRHLHQTLLQDAASSVPGTDLPPQHPLHHGCGVSGWCSRPAGSSTAPVHAGLWRCRFFGRTEFLTQGC